MHTSLLRFAALGAFLGLTLSLSACPPAKAKCDATSCASGCCDSTGTCQGGNTIAACGKGGNACIACSTGFSCTLGICGAGGSGGSAGGGAGGGGGSACTTDTFAGWPTTFFHANCAGSCHGSEFYTRSTVQLKLSSIRSRISSGNMPQGYSLSSADQTRILTYLGCGAP